MVFESMHWRGGIKLRDEGIKEVSKYAKPEGVDLQGTRVAMGHKEHSGCDKYLLCLWT